MIMLHWILLLFAMVTTCNCDSGNYGFGIGNRNLGWNLIFNYLIFSIKFCFLHKYLRVEKIKKQIAGDILFEDFLYTSETSTPLNHTIAFRYVAEQPVSFIEFFTENVCVQI